VLERRAVEAIYKSETITMIKQSGCAANTHALRLRAISIGNLALRATMLYTVHCLPSQSFRLNLKLLAYFWASSATVSSFRSEIEAE
jgi:hypothetical protein